MSTWEIAQIRHRVANGVLEQIFAAICQLEWGLSPAETQQLLGHDRKTADRQPVVDQQQVAALQEAR